MVSNLESRIQLTQYIMQGYSRNLLIFCECRLRELKDMQVSKQRKRGMDK